MEWPELLLIDKPTGITSFDVIRQLRRMYRQEHDGAKAPKLGHAGTLDPAASGLMLIGVGSGTKKLAELIKFDKEYIADILLGLSTTTGDREGEVAMKQAVELTADLRSAVTNVITDLPGIHHLPVSAYSAIKKDGVPMYKRARAAAKRGEVVTDVPVRDMVVHEAELLEIVDGEQPIIRVRFLVGSGTYIRSLAEEMGKLLGLPASLAALRRTRVGQFAIEEAIPLSKL